MIRRKDAQLREAIRWQVPGYRDEFYKHFEPTDRTQIKREIFKEHQIITTTLHEYPELERRFQDYQLDWMSRPLGAHQLNLVREFFANYLALLKKAFPKGRSLADQNKLDIVLDATLILIFLKGH